MSDTLGVEKYLVADAISDHAKREIEQQYEKDMAYIEGVPHEWLRVLAELVVEFPELTTDYYKGFGTNETTLDALHSTVDISPPRRGEISGVRLKVHFDEVFDEVTTLLRQLRSRISALELDGEPDEAEHVVRRVWTYESTRDDVDAVLKVMALPKNEKKAKCRLVETGETEPVKKIVCDD
jgi:hypothetical protein